MAKTLNKLFLQNGTGAVLSWLFLFLGIISMYYLGIFGSKMGIPMASDAASIFLSFIFGGLIVAILLLILYKQNVLFPKESFGEGSFYFIALLLLGWFISNLSNWLSGSGFHIFELFVVPSQQYLLSSVSAQMPFFWSSFLTNIGAPISEELPFLLIIPAVILIVLKPLSESFPVLKNKIVQIAIIIAIDAPLFAYFHVGNESIKGFFVAAALFRAVQIVMWETKTNKVITGAYGFHAGMNIASTGGILTFISVFLTETTGILILIFFGIMAYAGAVYALKKR